MGDIAPLSEDDANSLLRVGGVTAGLTSIHLQRGDRVEDDPLVALVVGEQFAQAIITRWNAALLREQPRSAREYAGQFADMPVRRPLPGAVRPARS